MTEESKPDIVEHAAKVIVAMENRDWEDVPEVAEDEVDKCYYRKVARVVLAAAER